MKPCIILGNGPSLNDLPADVFASMPSFGCNYIDRQPTYYVCVDRDILTNHVEEIRPLVAGARIAYLSGLIFDEFKGDIFDLPYVKLVYKDTESFKDEEFMSGMTAAYVALKMAYYAGFDCIHLWGVDMDPAWTHYKPDYHQGGVTNAQRRAVMLTHYQLAANIYARAGRTIINHSHKSALDKIFRRA